MNLLRLLVLPLALLAEALGGLHWLFWSYWFGSDPIVRGLRSGFFGLTGPEMDQHWQRLFKWQSPHAFYESLKNIITEWIRLDARRGAKMLLVLVVVSFVAGIVLGRRP